MRQLLISKPSMFATFIHSCESMKQRNHILGWIFVTMIFLLPPPWGINILKSNQYTEVNFDGTDSHDISSQEKRHFLLSNENFV